MSLIVNSVSDEKELKSIYRLRYKVYCYEWGFENPDNHPNEMVTDTYDNHAVHFGVKDDNQKIAGAISLILNSSEGFPAEKYCELDVALDGLPRDSIAEISRLVIHRNYRRRSEDKYIYGPDEERRSIGSYHFSSGYAHNRTYVRRSDDKKRRKGTRHTNESYTDKRRRHEVMINLYKAIYQESKRRQITHWYAVMTKGIVLFLDKFGFTFESIGDPVDYHGIRTPYLGDIEKIEQGIVDASPELYEELTRGI